MTELKAKDLVKGGAATLGADIHWLRAYHEEDILTCAEKLNVDYRKIEALESGKAETIDLELIKNFATLYDEKIFIGIGNEYV